ncbi:MAG: hypothetical protein HY054_02225 [Proteobacteria bacterium]|nr:hypothetical protein [Pseudomonadota bacterium]
MPEMNDRDAWAERAIQEARAETRGPSWGEYLIRIVAFLFIPIQWFKSERDTMDFRDAWMMLWLLPLLALVAAVPIGLGVLVIRVLFGG